MRKFQKLIEVQSLHSEPISPKSKLTSFYTDMRKTASMYKDFWEELSTHFPNILIVSQKAHDLYSKAQHVRQQWENIGPEFDPHSEVAHTYNYFRLNVLYDEKERTPENTNGYSWSPDNHKNSQMSLKQGNSLNHKGKLSKEDDGALISTIVKSLYEEKKGRGYSVPLRFNGREDFTEFLGDNKLPSRVLRKKKEVIVTSLCPYLFMIILVILSLTRNITSSFDTFETQYQRNLITADLHSEINNVFEWKEGILNTSIDTIKSGIHNNLNLLESLENKMILPTVTQKSLRSYAKTNISLWTPAMTKNTTELMMQKANAFVEIETDKLTKDDPNYLFWANNMQGEYYQGLLNWNQLIYNDLKEYSEAMPFNTLMGLLFFLCTFAIIFLNLLNIYKLIALGNDAMNIYLSISQPELDALKAKCQIFLDYLETLDAKKNGEENSNLGIEDKPLLVRQIHPGLQQRVRIKPLKQYKKPRTELESRICSTIMLLIAVSFLFIIPIPFQRKYKVLVDQQVEGFSNIIELETEFSFSYNTLKQQLIHKTSVFEYENATIPLKLSHDKLLQIAQQFEGNKFQDFMTGEFCHTLNGQVQERCTKFIEEKSSSGAESILDKKIESLQEITNEYNNNLIENKDSSTESSSAFLLLRNMEKEVNLNSFREDFLKPGLQILRNSYPQMVEETFKETLQMVILYDIIAILLWTAVVFVLFYRVMRPLYRFVEARKKLIRLIPFPLLMNMKDEVIGYIWTYCEVPTHDTRNRNADGV